MLCLVAAMMLVGRQNRVLRESQRPVSADGPSPLREPQPVVPEAPSGTNFALPPTPSEPLPPEQRVVLENEAVRLFLTTHGGAIRTVEFKNYPAERGGKAPYVFNREGALPALALAFDGPENYRSLPFTVTRREENVVQFTYKGDNGLEIVRGYRLPSSGGENPYLLNHETLVRSSQTPIRSLFLHLGSFPATPGDHGGEYLNFGYYDGKKAAFIKSRDFSATNGFLGLGRREARSHVFGEPGFIRWGSVKNQFFAAILTPDEPAQTFFTRPGLWGSNDKKKTETIEGSLGFAGQNSSEKVLSLKYYVGPKDFLHLNHMGDEQDLVMEFGFFGPVSKILLLTMLGIHHFVPNWGWTIILLTIFIKLLMWPLTSAQVRSAKRMTAIQKPLQEIREKYKNNPQKIQAETMRLFKEHKVNPAMGCLPLLIQLPIFIGLYVMLRTSSEMRFQKFLWIQDLSIPDTVAHWGTFPINVLPLLMGVTMFFQMRLTPAPAADNAQQKMLQWMPFIFLLFCYSFPSALVLYWTVQNVLTIVQQGLTKSSEPVEAVGHESPRRSKKPKDKHVGTQ
jgi:YidC/Oxa1 family membrane protein insertase